MDNVACNTEERPASEQHETQNNHEHGQANHQPPEPVQQTATLSTVPVVWRPLMLEP
jgi:hypothetical protein